MMAHYERSEHARALLKSGLTAGGAVLLELPRQARRPPEDGSRRRRPTTPTSPTTCGSCHSGILREWAESAHGIADDCQRRQEASEGTGVLDLPRVARRQAARPAVVRHADVRRLRQLPRGGPPASTTASTARRRRWSNRKAAACADCHTPHANLPASDPRSSIHPDNLAKTCGACHANVNASFLSFDPHADPTDPKRNPYVYLDLARHDRAAARRVRLLRPARPAVDAARAGRQAARRVRRRPRRRPARTCAASAACRWPCTSPS